MLRIRQTLQILFSYNRQASKGPKGYQNEYTRRLKQRLNLRMKIGDSVFEGAELDFVEQAAVEAALA